MQITASFDLFAAAKALPYLHDLGVDWVYLSPLLASEPGSDHGYDVVAFDHVDPERGGAEGLATLSQEARRLGMGVLVDIVPNHVGVATPSEDPWWWDVLRLGRASEHATAFDIDWAAGDGKIVVPILGDDDEGAIRVVGDELRYHEHRFPMAPGTTTHEEQHYRLVHWQEADENLNYRRFFAVNTLAAVRVEDPEVFAETHVEVRRWFTEGLVDGLRVDHPDGLRDPQRYLEDLAALTGGAYVLVEKILEPGERLPDTWQTEGTTGYDALALVDRVLVDPAGREPLDALESWLRAGEGPDEAGWPAFVQARKLEVVRGILRSEVLRIVRELQALDPALSEGALEGPLEDAVAHLLAAFPVYRSYLPEGREHLDQAFAAARAAAAHVPASVFDRLEQVLGDPWTQPARRFQQTSGMVMAKGVEDCAFYRWSRLTSLNEVGGDPSVFSLDPAGFHRALAERQRVWPHAMTTLSTHDTKRGEDVRARLHVLAEDPRTWADALRRLLALVPLPDAGFASLLWQAALGVWGSDPDEVLRERLHGYATKAMREAGDRTTWTDPDEEYEAAVQAAVDAAFDEPEVRAVLDDLLRLTEAPGWSNAVAAKLVALTMPGVPDVYQGSELAEQSLVDPDNRRPVDLDRLSALLAEAGDRPAKLHVTATALRLRRDRPDLFTAYDAVGAVGGAAEHVLAFDRGGAVTVATRLPLGLAARGGWGDTRLDLPAGRWRDVLTDRPASLDLARLLDTHPVALLVREEG